MLPMVSHSSVSAWAIFKKPVQSNSRRHANTHEHLFSLVNVRELDGKRLPSIERLDNILEVLFSSSDRYPALFVQR